MRVERQTLYEHHPSALPQLKAVAVERGKGRKLCGGNETGFHLKVTAAAAVFYSFAISWKQQKRLRVREMPIFHCI